MVLISSFINKRTLKKITGFTLLEVMVALAIFAISALALLNTQSTQIKTDQHLTHKTLAHWVALNYLADMRLQNIFPEMGERSAASTMAGREWLVKVKTQSTPSANVRLVEISVALAQKDNAQEINAEKLVGITTVVGFISRAQEQHDSSSPAS